MYVNNLTLNDLKTQNHIEIDLSRKILEFFPSAVPLITILRNMKKRPTDSYEFGHWERDRWADQDKVTIASAAGQTVIDVNDASIFNIADLIIAPRIELQMLVTAVDEGANKITVVRPFGEGVVDADMNVDEEILILSSAKEDGSDPRPGKTQLPDKYTNYAQIFEEYVEFTGRANAEKKFYNLDFPKEVNRALKKIQVDINKQFWFGVKQESVINGKHISATEGIIPTIKKRSDFVTTNLGAFTDDEFDYEISRILELQESKEIWVFGGFRPMSVINSFAKNKLQIDPRTKEWGVQIQNYFATGGIAHLVMDASFQGTEYSSYLALLNLNNVTYRYFRTRDLKIRIQRPDADLSDKMKAVIRADVGIEVEDARKMGLIKGITV